MKALAILSRVVFSAVILLALALYLQASPTITLAQFCDSVTPGALCGLLCGVNTVTVLLALIVLLGIFSCTRILEAAWNVLFGASIILLLACGLYAAFGPSIALPHAIYHNATVNEFCQAMPDYPVLIAIITLIFIVGWLCASACVRVAITTVVSYGLWYAITEFFTYIVQLWADSTDPALPEALNMVQSTPWVIAAVPAAFFLIYALLMAFFETFISHAPTSKAKETKEEIPAEKPQTEEKPASADKPVLKVKPAAKQAETKPAVKTKPEEKPASEAKAEEATKPEEKPAGEAKAEEAPKPEEKPAGEAKAENTPKAEEKTETT